MEGKEPQATKSAWLGGMSLKNHLFFFFFFNFYGYSWVLIVAVVTLYNGKQQ